MSADIVPFKRKSPKPVIQDEKLAPPTDTDLVGFINTLHFLLNQGASESITIDLSIEELVVNVRQYHDVDDDDDEFSSASGLEFIATAAFDTEIHSMDKLKDQLREIFKRIDIDYYSSKHPEEPK